MSGRCESKRLRAVLWIVVCLCLPVLPARADILPLVLSGDPVPGAPGSVFTAFEAISINTSGTVAFEGSFTNGTTNGNGVFQIQNGQIVPIVMEGQPAPDEPSSAFVNIVGISRINSAGNFVFETGLTGHPAYFQALYATSGATLYRIVDTNTAMPGMPGFYFQDFGTLVVNDQGEILFAAQLSNSNGGFIPGSFSWSQGTLSMVAPCAEGLTLNNPGAFACNDYSAYELGGTAISVYSGGSATRIISPPYSIPNSTQVTQMAKHPSINDAGDVAFLSDSFGIGFIYPSLVPNAILHWHSGSIDKIAAAGDPVPGFGGGVFAGFGPPRMNNSAILFTAAALLSPNNLSLPLIERSQNGQLNAVVSNNDYLDDIGPLNPIAADFDNQDGKVVAFVATSGLIPSGIYAATTGTQYSLRFPHIADGGGGAAGGWRTTFILANRSATAANATISFYDDNGNPLSLMIDGTPQTQTAIVVPALGVAQIQTQGGAPLTTGWALVQSDQNLTGLGIYGLLDGSGNSITEVGVPSSLPLSSMSVFAQNDATTSTGIALANPNSTAANVTLTLMDSNSTPLAQTSITIPPMGHLAQYANQFFSAIPPGEFQGEIQVLSTQPLAGLTLRQRGSVFTSLPVIP